MTNPLKSLVSVVWPEGLLLLAAVAALRPGGLPAWSWPLVQAYAYIVLAAGIVLGLYIKQSRILLSVLLLGLADRALWMVGSSPDAQVGQTVFNSVALMLPINVLGLALITT